MAKHNVYFNLPTRELGKSDIFIDIYSNDEKHGTITISKGAIEWYPTNAKKPYKLDWSRFDRMIKDHFGE
jgi:hypothetical protein